MIAILCFESECAPNGRVCRDHDECCSNFCRMISPDGAICDGKDSVELGFPHS